MYFCYGRNKHPMVSAEAHCTGILGKGKLFKTEFRKKYF